MAVQGCCLVILKGVATHKVVRVSTMNQRSENLNRVKRYCHGRTLLRTLSKPNVCQDWAFHFLQAQLQEMGHMYVEFSWTSTCQYLMSNSDVLPFSCSRHAREGFEFCRVGLCLSARLAYPLCSQSVLPWCLAGFYLGAILACILLGFRAISALQIFHPILVWRRTFEAPVSGAVAPEWGCL